MRSKVFISVLIIITLYAYFTFVKKKETEIYVTKLENKTIIINCNLITIDTLEMIGSSKMFLKGIPAVIHYSYMNKRIPMQYLAILKNCIQMNPDITFVLWTDEAFLRFIKLKYPPDRVAIYRSYLQSRIEKLKKSDEMRNYILHYFGGIYMDMDMLCVHPFNAVMNQFSCILDKEEEVQTNIVWNRKFHVMNNFMACVKNHNFFKKLVFEQTREKGNIIWNTGPIRLTAMYHNYLKSLTRIDKKNPHKALTLAPSTMFSPLVVKDVGRNCMKKGHWRKKGCRKLKEMLKTMPQRINEAIAVHLFMGLGYSRSKSKIKRRIPICQFLRKIYIFSPQAIEQSISLS